MQFKNNIVKPYFTYSISHTNPHKKYEAPIVIIPTLAIHPWEKQNRNPKRYGKGRFEQVFQAMIWFLFWEVSFSINRKNYKYT